MVRGHPWSRGTDFCNSRGIPYSLLPQKGNPQEPRPDKIHLGLHFLRYRTILYTQRPRQNHNGCNIDASAWRSSHNTHKGRNLRTGGHLPFPMRVYGSLYHQEDCAGLQPHRVQKGFGLCNGIIHTRCNSIIHSYLLPFLYVS